MHDEARREIEQLVVGVVEAAEELGLKMGRHGGVILGKPNIPECGDLSIKTAVYVRLKAAANNRVDINGA